MSFISVLFDSSENPLSLGAKFRKKRLEDFESLVLKTFDSNQSIRILDVGGAEYFWKNSALLQRNNFEILLLNLQKNRNYTFQNQKCSWRCYSNARVFG